MPSTRHTHPPNRLDLCLHILTFGNSRGTPQIPFPILLRIDLSTYRAPPRHLRHSYTGASPELAASFFSLPGHESLYREMRHELVYRLQRPRAPPGACVAVLVNCVAGMHRSVAVAERLAGDVERLRVRGLRVVVEHLDTDVGRRRRRERRMVVRGCGWGGGGSGTSRRGGYGGRYGAGYYA